MLQNYNSVYSDRDLSRAAYVDTNTPGGSRFAAVQTIMKARCATSGCHTSFLSYSENDYVNTLGYAVAGSATSSRIYQKLKGATASGNMPLTGAALSNDDLGAFRDWINNMSVANLGGSSGGTTASDRTTAALAVISSNCASCHTITRTAISTSYSGATVPAFANYTTDSQFVTGGVVVVGDASTSWLYRSLQIYGDIGTMPKSASAISATDKQKIVDWIAGINQP